MHAPAVLLALALSDMSQLALHDSYEAYHELSTLPSGFCSAVSHPCPRLRWSAVCR